MYRVASYARRDWRICLWVTPPVLAPTAAAALMGKAPSEETIAAAEIALINDLSPRSDLHGSVNGKLHWAKVLFGRSVRQLGKSA